MKRTSKVGNIYINASSYSSIVQIGDANYADPYIRAIAVQQEGAIFDTESFPFTDYQIFSKPFIELTNEIDIDQRHIHHNRNINVRSIDIEGTTGSAIVQVGNLRHIDAKARIKHIRILRDEN
jgi:spore germination protein PE